MKVYFCTTESSKKYKSWSNIPYLLHTNLEKRGHIVCNYVMREAQPFRALFNFPVRVWNRFYKDNVAYFYVRTPAHFFLTYLLGRWIGLISTKPDVMLVQGFSYPLNNGKNRQILLGDWPTSYLFEKFLKRLPNRYEQKSIERENQVIEAADAVVTLFPDVLEYMSRKYKNKHIYCFGNVVNIDDDIVVPADIQHRKLASTRLLFIGKPFYLAGALELISGARNLRRQGFNCEVDIIGIDPDLIGIEFEWLRVHGYLDKDKPDEKCKYYDLLANAKFFVNTTPGWSSFQALLEAMYFHNPIVVRTNDILQGYFPNLKDVAHIVDSEGRTLEAILTDILTDSVRYQQMSEAARAAVEFSTWQNFTGRLTKLFQLSVAAEIPRNAN